MHQIANHNKTSTCPFRLSVSPSHARPLFSHCFLLTEWLYHPFLKQSTRSVPVPLWVQQSWGMGTMCRRRESSRWARGWRILWMFNIAIHRSLHHGMKWPRTPVLICEWKKKKKMHNVRGIWKRKRLESERKQAGNILSLLLCEKCYKFVKYSTLLPEILSYLFGRGCNWQFYCKKEEKK